MQTLELEEKKKLLEKLTSKIGKQVKLKISRIVFLCDEPYETNRHGHIMVVFLGVYGLKEIPIYIHGLDKDGKEVLFRNSRGSLGGCSNIDVDHTLKSIDDIDIEALFQDSLRCEYSDCTDQKYKNIAENFIAKIKNVEPRDEHLAIKILNGNSKYPEWDPCYWFNEPDFLKQVITYLDKII